MPVIQRRDVRLVASLFLVWLSLPSCGSREAADPVPPAGLVAAATEADAVRPRVVALGDSLTAGLGLPSEEAYPALLEARLRAEGYDVDVVNAGVSGDTSAGGLRRLDWALEGDVRILIVALGGNDGLRGLSVAQMTENLGSIIVRAKAHGVAVLLAGMEAPPNFGPSYTAQFREGFRDVAREHQVVFVPFLLEGVAGNVELNQADGIHPNADGARKIAAHLWSVLKPMLDTSVQSQQ